ncbi:MAG: hypothetical protein PUI24_10440 [Spirochaetales bacterium]|nr:hypothetical protein [Spirochaetales bacterium]
MNIKSTTRISIFLISLFSSILLSCAESDDASNETGEPVEIAGSYTISEANGSSFTFAEDGNWTYKYSSTTTNGTWSASGRNLTITYSAGGYSASAVFTVSSSGDSYTLTGKSGDFQTIIATAFMITNQTALQKGMVTLEKSENNSGTESIASKLTGTFTIKESGATFTFRANKTFITPGSSYPDPMEEWEISNDLLVIEYRYSGGRYALAGFSITIDENDENTIILTPYTDTYDGVHKYMDFDSYANYLFKITDSTALSKGIVTLVKQ